MKLEDTQISAHYNDDANIMMIRLLPPCVETVVHYLDIEPSVALLLNNRDEIVGFQIENWQRCDKEKIAQLKHERNAFRDSWNRVMVENDSLRERNEKLREQNERLREALKAML